MFSYQPSERSSANAALDHDYFRTVIPDEVPATQVAEHCASVKADAGFRVKSILECMYCISNEQLNSLAENRSSSMWSHSDALRLMISEIQTSEIQLCPTLELLDC